MLCQRRCRRRNQQAAQDQAAEIIRVSLRNLNLLGMDEASQDIFANAGLGLGMGPGGAMGALARGLSPEDRREYIKNVLVSRVRI